MIERCTPLSAATVITFSLWHAVCILGGEGGFSEAKGRVLTSLVCLTPPPLHPSLENQAGSLPFRSKSKLHSVPPTLGWASHSRNMLGMQMGGLPIKSFFFFFIFSDCLLFSLTISTHACNAWPHDLLSSCLCMLVQHTGTEYLLHKLKQQTGPTPETSRLAKKYT